MSDHRAQLESHALPRVNRRRHIRQELYPKGHPWQNLVESQFGIQKRLGEYAWSRCRRMAEAAEIHRDLIRDHNRLPHGAHRQRNDNQRTPLEVLGPARGRETDAATLHRAFHQMVWRRKTDPQGLIPLGRWRVYVESGWPRTPGEVTDWEGLLRAEYQDYFVSQHHGEWDAQHHRPPQISHLHCFEHPYPSRQQPLFDAQWIREPVEEPHPASQSPQPGIKACQLPLFLGPMLVR